MEMERETMSSVVTCSTGKDEDDDVPLPGFRFHPTDEELVGFYLKRKVEKRPISIELIKQIDIYKFDPWDLPKASNVGDKEWYFFCKRGRKYKNSIRPNRVTGSGFWKATGIDRPIYSAGGEGRDCIGLKKSLVYYRGSAGKGTKTDWMMHEFRLPSDHEKTSNRHHVDAKSNINAQEAEVWTLCRIFKRNVPYRKCIPDWKELSRAGNKRTNTVESFSKTSGMESTQCNYISFSTGGGAAAAAPAFNINNISNRLIMNNNNNSSSNVDRKPLFHSHVDVANHQLRISQLNSLVSQAPSSNMINASSSSFPMSADLTELLKHGDWDELGSVLESGASHGLL